MPNMSGLLRLFYQTKNEESLEPGLLDLLIHVSSLNFLLIYMSTNNPVFPVSEIAIGLEIPAFGVVWYPRR